MWNGTCCEMERDVYKIELDQIRRAVSLALTCALIGNWILVMNEFDSFGKCEQQIECV